MLVFTTSKFGCHQEIAKWLGSLLALKREWVASSPSFVDGHPHDLLHLGNVSSILSDSASFCGTVPCYSCETIRFSTIQHSWGVETVGAAKQIIMEVAETSCNDMHLAWWAMPAMLTENLEDAAIWGSAVPHDRCKCQAGVPFWRNREWFKTHQTWRVVHHYSPINTH